MTGLKRLQRQPGLAQKYTQQQALPASFFCVGLGFFISSILYLNRTKEHCLSKPVPSSEENSSKRNMHTQLQSHILVLLSTAENTAGISRCL